MAWTKDIDPTKPLATDLVSSGDDQIRDLKTALNERLSTLIEGWPETQPLMLAAALVGDDDDKPDASDFELDGILYIATDVGKTYYAYNGAWHQLSTGGTTTPPEYNTLTAPSGVGVANISSCVSDAPVYKVRVTWTDTVVGATTKIYANGVLKETVAYDVETKDVTLTAAGSYIIELQHVLSGEVSTRTSTPITLSNPCAAGSSGALNWFTATDASYCDSGPTSVYLVALGFSKSDPAAKVRINRNGVQIYLLGASVVGPLSYALPTGEEEGVHVFEAMQVVDGVDGPSISSSVTIGDPCGGDLAIPGSFDVNEDGACVGVSSNNRALISWTNPDPALQTRIYRDASLLHTAAPGVTSYVDTTVITTNSYSYTARAYDSGGPTESAPTAQAIYSADELCPDEE